MCPDISYIKSLGALYSNEQNNHDASIKKYYTLLYTFRYKIKFFSYRKKYQRKHLM